MEQIDLPKFLALFNCMSVDDCWLNTGCVIDETGIKPKHSDKDLLERANYLHKLRLDFPCTEIDLFYWAKGLEGYADTSYQGNVIDRLPKEFVDKWLPNYMLFRIWCYSQVSRNEKIGTDKPFVVDWAYWLNLSEKWTKKQAALLIFGLEPNEFEQVDINANALGDCRINSANQRN